MSFTAKLSILLLCAAASSACKKSGDKHPEPAVASAPAPPPGITIKYGDQPISGAYDGLDAIALLPGNNGTVVLAHECGPGFGCGVTTQWANAIDDEKLKAACPKGAILNIEIADIKGPDDPKPGKHKASLYTVQPDGGFTKLDDGDVLEVTERTADTVSGKVTYEDGATSVKGTFKATICKAPK